MVNFIKLEAKTTRKIYNRKESEKSSLNRTPLNKTTKNLNRHQEKNKNKNKNILNLYK